MRPEARPKEVIPEAQPKARPEVSPEEPRPEAPPEVNQEAQEAPAKEAQAEAPPEAQTEAKPAVPLTAKELQSLRKEARNRNRRILFNNDGADAVFYKDGKTTLPSDANPIEAFLEQRDPRKGVQIDTVFYCTERGSLGLYSHATKVGTPYSSKHVPPGRGDYNLLPRLLEAGTDPLAKTVEMCRESGKEIFWSMRMNDTHDQILPPERRSDFKNANLNLLMSTRDKPPKFTTWSAMDYGSEKVRNFVFEVIQDVVENYDVDGVELDFFRHPQLFRSVANGGKASPGERDKLTGLIGRIRAMLDETGRKKGKPLLLAVRAPDSVEFNQAIGMDLEHWFKLGLVDLYIPGGYFLLNDWSYSAELGHRYGVRVYADLSDSRIERWEQGRNSLESYRGRALEALEAGADGIYLFNYFNTAKPHHSELGSMETLRGKDRVYYPGGVMGWTSQAGCWLANSTDYAHRLILTPGQPLVLSPGKRVEIPLQVPLLEGEENARLELRLLSTVPASALKASLNGIPLSSSSESGSWTQFPLEASMIRKGRNVMTLEAGDAPPSWQSAYSGEGLPKWPWIIGQGIVGSGKANPAVVIKESREGLLIADRGENPGDDLYVSCQWNVRRQDATRVTFRMKTLKGWNRLILSNGKSEEHIQFFPDRVEFAYSRLVFPMKTAEKFHDYAVEIRNNNIRLWVDGKLRINGAGRFTHPAPGGRNRILFGAADSKSLGEAIWAQMGFDTSERTALVGDVMVDVRFP